MRHFLGIAAALLFIPLAAAAQVATSSSPAPATTALPAGTVVRVTLLAQLASNTAKTGDVFQFRTIDAVLVGGSVLVQKGSTGNGTIKLASAAASYGQEGDLTLNFDTVGGSNGNAVAINSELAIQGKNAKGVASIFGNNLSAFGSAIRGADIGIPTNQVIDLASGAKGKLEPNRR